MSAGIGSGLCRCGHNRLSHEVEDAPACVHESCDCVAFTAATQPPGQVVGARPAGPGAVDDLLARAKTSGHKPIASLAARIEDQLATLRERVAAEGERLAEQRRRDAEKERARQEVERLENELAAARARLRGGPPPARPQAAVAAAGKYACPAPACDRRFTGKQGLRIHQGRAHRGAGAEPEAKAG